MSDTHRWYVLQTQSRHENRVRRLIQQEIDKQPEGKDGEIREILIPEQEVIELRAGKRQTVTKPLYPGYVLVEMVLSDRTEHAINAMKGVRFVTHGGDPQPLREKDINRLLGIEEADESTGRQEIPFRTGQVVEVIQGPFTDFSGTVQDVFPEKGKVKVEVSLFGRPTSVELDFTQLKGF